MLAHSNGNVELGTITRIACSLKPVHVPIFRSPSTTTSTSRPTSVAVGNPVASYPPVVNTEGG
eukprot:CAMPEP_0119527436 /NCGR_PEP_ID=MMETSP1344-20130328/41838_1 /TAXON_ID=236787 /ORGANISM="Florenciella parvula, Strain CCMP2471" /LENGTH=62 /DNA_ID=CAMNT_0007566625 /DNA_START=137 /DNA_END=325 /DNA_ORIENTATION=+